MASQKLCERAQKMLATIRRGGDDKWQSNSLFCANLASHVERCPDGCGRNLDGVEWPPKGTP